MVCCVFIFPLYQKSQGIQLRFLNFGMPVVKHFFRWTTQALRNNWGKILLILPETTVFKERNL